jgi:hypothetical protein
MSPSKSLLTQQLHLAHSPEGDSARTPVPITRRTSTGVGDRRPLSSPTRSWHPAHLSDTPLYSASIFGSSPHGVAVSYPNWHSSAYLLPSPQPRQEHSASDGWRRRSAPVLDKATGTFGYLEYGSVSRDRRASFLKDGPEIDTRDYDNPRQPLLKTIQEEKEINKSLTQSSLMGSCRLMMYSLPAVFLGRYFGSQVHITGFEC